MSEPVISMKVEGLAELQKSMENMAVEVQSGISKSAVFAAGHVVKKKAQALAPVDEGVLRKSIYVKYDKENSSDVQQAVIVSVRHGKRYQKRGMDAWYWKFVEFGTRFMKAFPFMRPAFDSTITQQIDTIAKVLWSKIERLARKGIQ